jgi:hypothetical protein
MDTKPIFVSTIKKNNMSNYKLHLAGSNKTKDSFQYSLPICGKISTGIEYETLTKEEFSKIQIDNRCKNCNNIFNNK